MSAGTQESGRCEEVAVSGGLTVFLRNSDKLPVDSSHKNTRESFPLDTTYCKETISGQNNGPLTNITTKMFCNVLSFANVQSRLFTFF